MKDIIFKTWQKATYLKGLFSLRDNAATPINFPTVFVAYGAGIKSGNWQRGTEINTPSYVIKNYFDGIGDKRSNEAMYHLWFYCRILSKLTWNDVKNDKEAVIELIDFANNELNKLTELN